MIRSFYLSKSGETRTDLSSAEIREALAEGGVLWVDFFRATREEAAILSDVFRFHPLAIDDCHQPAFRPKVEFFDEHLFLICHGPDLAGRGHEVRTLELDAFLGPNCLVTFHQVPLRSIVNTLEKCEKSPAQTLGFGADFLLYTILNEMAENYAPILRRAEARVAEVEEKVLEAKGREDILPELMRLRHDLMSLRRVIVAQRDAVNLLVSQPPQVVTERAQVYFRDIVSLYRRVLDVIDIQSDALAGARDTYLALISNRMNEIMKTLTVIALIMLPATVVSGIYGMNYDLVPANDWRFGFTFAIVLMAAISGGMFWFFKRKKWL